MVGKDPVAEASKLLNDLVEMLGRLNALYKEVKGALEETKLARALYASLGQPEGSLPPLLEQTASPVPTPSQDVLSALSPLSPTSDEKSQE